MKRVDPIGKRVPVPAGLKGECSVCRRVYRTDGTDVATAERGMYLPPGKPPYGPPGKTNYKETGTVWFFLPCPKSDGGYITIETGVRIADWGDKA